MKKLLFIFLFCFISFFSKSQDSLQNIFDEIETEIKDGINKSPKSPVLYENGLTSGDYLIKAGNNKLIGTGIIIIGGGLSILMSTVAEAPDFGLMIGSLSGLTGFVLHIVGTVYIVKSGKIHNKEKGMSLRVNSTQNGMGLCLNF